MSEASIVVPTPHGAAAGVAIASVVFFHRFAIGLDTTVFRFHFVVVGTEPGSDCSSPSTSVWFKTGVVVGSNGSNGICNESSTLGGLLKVDDWTQTCLKHELGN